MRNEITQVKERSTVVLKLQVSNRQDLPVILKKHVNEETQTTEITCFVGTELRNYTDLTQLYPDSEGLMSEKYCLLTTSELSDYLEGNYNLDSFILFATLLTVTKNKEGFITFGDLQPIISDLKDLHVLPTGQLTTEEVETYLAHTPNERTAMEREAISLAQQQAVAYRLTEQDYLEVCYLYKTMYHLALHD